MYNGCMAANGEGNGSGIRRKIDRTAKPECPSCGANDWVIQEGAEAGTLLLQVEGALGGTEILLYICGNCGFLRMHSIAALQGEI